MIRTLRSNINLNEKLIDINFGSRFFIFEFHEILLCSNSRYKRNILHALFTKLCLFIGDLIRWFVAFWFSAEARFLCREKKEVRGAPRIAVVAARLNFNTPYKVIGDLSSSRRRVNQTENDRWLSSSFIVLVFRPSIMCIPTCVQTSSCILLVIHIRKPPLITFWDLFASGSRTPQKHIKFY